MQTNRREEAGHPMYADGKEESTMGCPTRDGLGESKLKQDASTPPLPGAMCRLPLADEVINMIRQDSVM